MYDPDKIEIGVVGSTPFWNEYGDALAQSAGVRVVAFADIDYSKKKDSKRPRNGAAYPDMSSLISAARISAMIVGAPTIGLLEPITAALRSGISVLALSPTITRFEEVDLLTQSASDGKSIFLPAFQRRFEGAFRFVKGVVADGQIGRVERISCHLPISDTTANGNGKPVLVKIGRAHV